MSKTSEVIPGSPLFENRYKYGFVTDIASDAAPKGLNEEIIRFISHKKGEPSWVLDFRLESYKKWLTMKEPVWSCVQYEPIDFQNMVYYSAPKQRKKYNSLEEVDPELLKTFEKLGVPIGEQKRLAGVVVDAVFDSVSVSTSHKDILKEQGIIFCSMSDAIKQYSDLVKQYLGSVVTPGDNFYSALNSAVFTDGSFCYIPKGVRCPVDLSTYFRINAAETGQFERTLIIAESDSFVNYLEGCTAPIRDENQLHAAVVEIVALDRAVVQYSTVQNWYAGDENGVGGIFNFVTKRGHCRGEKSKISWTQVEAGAAITWKYPSVIMEGDGSSGEFYSVALTNQKMQADTGTKMIHIGKNTKSVVISKGIAADASQNAYRGLVRLGKNAQESRNFTQCDSLLIGSKSRATTYPYIEVMNCTSQVEHEASTSSVNEEQLFYLKSRGIDAERGISLLLNGFCKEVFQHLPMEFAVEAVRLLEMKLEGTVG